MQIKPRLAALCALSTLLACSALADPVSKQDGVSIEEPKTFCDDYNSLLDRAVLYKGEGDLLQELKLVGRYHGQYVASESELGDFSGWQNRRFRFGAQAKFLKEFEFDGEFNLKTDFHQAGRLIDNVEDLNLLWKPSCLRDFLGGTSIKFGKEKPEITQEWATSSNYILTIELSNIVNNVRPQKAGGVVVSFADVLGFGVDLGAFSGGLSSDWSLPEFNAGYGLMGRLSLDITDASKVRFDYFYNDGDVNNVAFSPYRNIFSLNSTSHWNGWGLNTDVIYANDLPGGYGDIFGAVFMPWYDLTDKLKAVFRYTFSVSNGDTGVREEPVEQYAAGRLRGEAYQGFYLGLNYSICGDRLKLMNGVEYSTLEGPTDNQYWNFESAIRLFF